MTGKNKKLNYPNFISFRCSDQDKHLIDEVSEQFYDGNVGLMFRTLLKKMRDVNED